MIELYEFTSGSTVYRYTSANADVSHGGHTWEAVPIERSSIVSSENPKAEPLQIDTVHDHPVSMLHIAIPPDQPVSVVVFDYDGTTSTALWRGKIAGVTWEGARSYLDCRSSRVSHDRPGPRGRYQTMCRHALYGRACGVDKDLFKVVGTVTALSTTNPRSFTSLAVEMEPTPAQYTGGYVLMNSQSRLITQVFADGVVLLSAPVVGIAVGMSFEAFKGCDRSQSTCKNKFNNVENFGGITTFPIHNPYNRDITRRSE